MRCALASLWQLSTINKFDKSPVGLLLNSAAKLKLIARTLPHLRWEQLVYRPWRWLQFRAYRRVPFLTKHWIAVDKAQSELPTHTLYQFRQVFESQFAHWSVPLHELDERLLGLKAGRFTFLNQTLEIAVPDWNHRYVGHLWNYQFHYQDYAIWLARAYVERDDEQAWARCRELIESWIAQARVGASDGWDAYPVSMRLVHWIYAYALVAERESDQAFLARWRRSIFQQLDFLSRHLELHLLANHLFKNVKALVIGGLFFAHESRGQEWLHTGLRLLARELNEQILPDGGHYERAPMYHAQTLGDVLECYALLQACAPHEAKVISTELVQKMAGFLAAMSYPDGSLALFNDSANAFEMRPKPLLETARRLTGESLSVLPQCFQSSGYYTWQSAEGLEKIIVDAGEPAASYNTAHAHCDILSYELWMRGQPFIVDSGVRGYGGDRFREYCRSTRAHNTLMVDDLEQSEVWGTFRLARRAQNIHAEVLPIEAKQVWHWRGSYTDYRSDRQRRYVRYFQRVMNGTWEVREQLHLSGKQTELLAQSFIHLHPSVKAKVVEQSVICETHAGFVTIETFGVSDIELIRGAMTPQVQGWWFPEFGQAEPATTIVLKRNLVKVSSVTNKGASPFHEFGYRIKPQE